MEKKYANGLSSYLAIGANLASIGTSVRDSIDSDKRTPNVANRYVKAKEKINSISQGNQLNTEDNKYRKGRKPIRGKIRYAKGRKC